MMSATTPPVEQDYIGLSNSKSKISSSDEEVGYSALKTELSLSLPGSVSPDKTPTKPVLGLSLFGEEAQAQPKLPNGYAFNSMKSSSNCSARAFAGYGGKRGFADASGKWGLSVSGGSDAGKGVNLVENGGGAAQKPGQVKDMDIDGGSPSLKSVQEKKPAIELGSAPASKAQVVGWPPIRSFRKNTMASANTKDSNEADVDGKSGLTCLYVKVSMDGAPYLRKVDLRLYNNYMELSLALKKMFSCFPVGKDGQNGSHLKDFSHGSECVLTYEDKDGDWMLVGDVPWEMFTSTCKRLRIMKGSEAIGLAPRDD